MRKTSEAAKRNGSLGEQSLLLRDMARILHEDLSAAKQFLIEKIVLDRSRSTAFHGFGIS